jgi:aryl-alcohol dehydrogenase-like predicted oxidoreductase
MPAAVPGGALALADDLVLSRMGYGAMQLAGPGVFGPPKDLHESIAVLRMAVDLGVTHIGENVAAAGLVLPADAIAELDAISPARSA